MKIIRPKRQVEASGDFENEYFGIGDMALVMDILRNKLYPEPIKALTREIVSNARDAHREANKPEVPVEVFLPSKLQPEFYIRDFGLGISPDRMVNVFIKYGCSTKRNDDQQTGGFGIGAKSPFAYMDSFGIESITPNAQGILFKRVYIAHIDETNKGKLSLVKTTRTKEPQGTKIIVPCNPSDIAEFARYIQVACQYWDVKPTILNSPQDTPFWREDLGLSACPQENFWFNTDESGDNIALVDGIPYPLHTKALIGQEQDSEFQRSLTSQERALTRRALEQGLCLKFAVNEVAVAANREELDYKGNNKQLIYKRIKAALKRFKALLVEAIEQQPSLLDACRLISKAPYKQIRYIFGSDHTFLPADLGTINSFAKELTYKGRIVTPGFALPSGLVASTYMLRHQERNTTAPFDAPRKIDRLARSEFIRFSSKYISLSEEHVNVWRDDGNLISRVRKIFAENPKVGVVSIIQRGGYYPNPGVQAWVDKYAIPDFGINPLSSFAVMRTAPSKNGAKKAKAPPAIEAPSMMAKYEGGRWKTVQVDWQKPMVVCLSKNTRPTVFGSKLATKNSRTTALLYDFIDQAGFEFYMARTVNLKFLPPHCMSIENFIRKLVPNKKIIRQHHITEALTSYRDNLGKLAAAHEQLAANSPIHHVLQLLNEIKDAGELDSWRQLAQIAAWGGNKMFDHPKSADILTCAEILARYSLLRHLHYSTPASEIISYVNLIDSALERTDENMALSA